jgi:hypothetical protein
VESFQQTLAKLAKKLPSKKWTFGKEKELCSLWQKETLLYDSSHPDYRNTDKRKEAIDGIGYLMDRDGRFFLIL